MAKQPFPSARQARSPGLRRGVYPAYLRDQVDYDYVQKLSDEERIWLAAFTEEYLKGWKLKSETQVLPVELARRAWAEQRRVRQHQDPLLFGQQREELARETLRETTSGAGSIEDEIIGAIDRRRCRGR